MRVEMFEVERSTGAGGGHCLLVASSVAVRPELAALTVSDGRAQAEELLRHLDLLDVSQGVVPPSVHHHRHRICAGKWKSLKLDHSRGASYSLVFILIVWR